MVLFYTFYMGACILASCPLTSANHGSVAPIVTLIWRPYLAETRGAQCGAHCGASIQVPRGAHHLSKDARRVSHERLGRAKLDQPAGSEHEHLIRVEDRVEPVRNREHGHGGEFGAHRALEEGRRRSVERQGSQWPSEAIGGNQWPSEVISICTHLDEGIGLGVDRGGGLVHDHDCGSSQQRSRDA